MFPLGRALLMVSLIAAPAAAQTPAQLNPVGRGTELGGSVGVAHTASDTALVLSGTADWRITRRLTIEAAGGWFARGAGVNGISADIGALVNVVPKNRTTPYVGLAFGLYRTIIDPGATVPAGPRTFTDPAWRLSAGVDFVRHRNISVRPEASVLLVRRNGATDTVSIVAVRLGYAFEDRPVTPSVR